MAELDVQSKMLGWLRQAGGAGDKVIARGQNGYPDLNCYIPGKGVWLIEVKERSTVRNLQQRILQRLDAAGFQVAVIRAQGNTVTRLDLDGVTELGERAALSSWWTVL